MIPVHIIGLGMSPQDLTQGMIGLIQAADVLVGGARHLGYFADHPGMKIPVTGDLLGLFSRIKELSDTRKVVFLASGDPNFYGIGSRLASALGPERLIVHPNITTIQAAFARLKLAWDDVTVVSLHGRDWAPLGDGLKKRVKLAVYTDPQHTPPMIAQTLMDLGYEKARMCILENLGQSQENILWLSPEEAANQEFSSLNLVVIFSEDDDLSLFDPIHLGMDDEAFDHEAGLITKQEVRAVAIAKLALGEGQVLWDVGAGCGSVGIEASLLVPGGDVYAVEKRPEHVSRIHANRRRYGIARLQVVHGTAPECLAGLPSPDRVFVGGGGDGLASILRTCADRLKPAGRLVATAVRLETLETARAFLQHTGWPLEIVQLQVSRAKPLSEGIYLAALNPVWVVTATKPRQRAETGRSRGF